MLVLLETNFGPVSDCLCFQFSMIFSTLSMLEVSEILVPGPLILATDSAEEKANNAGGRS